MIKDSGNRTEFQTGAVRDYKNNAGRFDLAPWRGIWEVAKHCEEGAKKYGEHNVDKGIPIHSFIDSAFRHLVKYTLGMDDEPHLRAAAWNILWAMQTEIEHPELQDIPVWMEKQTIWLKNSEAPTPKVNGYDEATQTVEEEPIRHTNILKDSPNKLTNGEYIRSLSDKEL